MKACGPVGDVVFCVQVDSFNSGALDGFEQSIEKRREGRGHEKTI